MKDQEDIKKLFKEEEQIHFDFSQAPALVKRKERSRQETRLFKQYDISRWRKAQRSFLRWTKDRRLFTKEYIESGKIAYDTFFQKRGPLRGDVLDIGGGWGLYRQWWEPGESGVFIVHDPGVERFLRGPHESQRYYHQRAFSLPMSFVEGFGEDLPYKNDVFDTCLIAVTLDHCVDPQKVVAEAYRCLRPGGAILIIQTCRSSQPDSKPDSRRPNILKRLSVHLSHPKHSLTVLYERLFYSEHHLHHFSLTDITLLLERVGFSDIQTGLIPTIKDLYTFEVKKEPLTGTPFPAFD